MQSKNRYHRQKKSSNKKFCYKFMNKLIVIILISALCIEPVTRQGLHISGNHKAYADAIEHTGTQAEEGNPSKAAGPDTSGREAYGESGSISFPQKYAPIEPPVILGIPEVPEDTEAPGAPGNVVAVASGSAILINWDASLDNTAVRGYRIYRDEVEIGNSEEICYTDTSCTEGVTYLYSVRAYDAAGNLSEAGISMPVTAAVQDREEAANPDKPVGLTATAGEAGIILEWLEAAGADSYELSINGDIINVGNTTSYIQANAMPNCNYEYRVRAVNEFGVSKWSDSAVLFNGVSKVADLPQIIIPGGSISEDTVWDNTEGVYLVQGDLFVLPEVTLRIMPGVLVKFMPSCGVMVHGDLILEGTEEQPVVMTSEKDAEYGGSGIDTYEDVWTGITVSERGNFIGNYAWLRCGGALYSTLKIYGAMRLDNSRVSDTYGYGIWIDSYLDITVQGSVIENSEDQCIYS